MSESERAHFWVLLRLSRGGQSADAGQQKRNFDMGKRVTTSIRGRNCQSPFIESWVEDSHEAVVQAAATVGRARCPPRPRVM